MQVCLAVHRLSWVLRFSDAEQAHGILNVPSKPLHRSFIAMSNPQPPYPHGGFQPSAQPSKSHKVLWIVLGLVIGIPTVLMGGCVACLVLLSTTSNSNLANRNTAQPSNDSSSSSSSSSASERAEIDGMKVYRT